MEVKKTAKKKLTKLLKAWERDFKIVVPTRKNGIVEFSEWDGESIDFIEWYRNTTIPPKAILLPLWEEMIRFTKNDHSWRLEVPGNERKVLIFGVRPCDARGIAIIDDVFREGYPDYYYDMRRQRTVIVGLGCKQPYDSCFCTSLGIDPAASEDVDIMFTDAEDDFVIEAITDNGAQLLHMIDFIRSVNSQELQKARSAAASVAKNVYRKINMSGLDNKLSNKFMDSEFWKEVAAKCLGCGICTFLCPTCYCFEIYDDLFKKQGARYRGWDSCSFKLYTKMPMENPREEKWRRIRQKVYHKFEFHRINTGNYACTGCGRCIRLCPVNWDITQVIGEIAGLENASQVMSKSEV